MAALSDKMRKLLENVVTKARDIAEAAAMASLERLTVGRLRPHDMLTEQERAVRAALREEALRLGDAVDIAQSATVRLPRLAAECAYEHWHRILFSRFLADNGLLMHAEETNVPVSIADCRAIAKEAGGDDGWLVAARFAQRMLPGIFRNDDPMLQLELAPESRKALQDLAQSLPSQVFTSDDALGWVYQFWQAKRKDEVNKSGDKVGGDDICAVTQLFTEDYMVKFLLHNSLGAWWVNRHPGEPLPLPMEYLRRNEDGSPAAGGFEGWPNSAAEIKIMDPCCGSGHFLVAAFEIMVAFRKAEEGLTDAEAGAAVIRDNIHALELDPRCTQLAAFNLMLTAWKHGGYRTLPLPRIACSGLRVGGSDREWQRLAFRNRAMSPVLSQLFRWFQQAPELGSLIDPERADGDYRPTGDWSDVLRELESALAKFESEGDPAAAIFGEAAIGAARAADLLFRKYTLVCTNVPFLARGKHGSVMRDFISTYHSRAKGDLATAFVERCLSFCSHRGTMAVVTPQNWLFLGSYELLREELLEKTRWDLLVRLGPGAFDTISGEVVNVGLVTISTTLTLGDHCFRGLDASQPTVPSGKALLLRTLPLQVVSQATQLQNPDSRISLDENIGGALLENYADALNGMHGADAERFRCRFWEVSEIRQEWIFLQNTVRQVALYSGRENVFYWPDNGRMHRENKRAFIKGTKVWGKRGVVVNMMGDLPCTLYTGEAFDISCTPIVPRDPSHIPAIWAFCSSPEYRAAVRRIDQKMNVTNATLAKVPFDLEYWQNVAANRYPNGLPQPYSDDPTQWLFHGHPARSTGPLQVAVGRLLGYLWPEHGLPDTKSGRHRQDDDGLNVHKLPDGIACLSAVGGDQPVEDRLRALIVEAYGAEYQSSTIDALISGAGHIGRTLEDYLRNDFFKDHCGLFHNRPFLWHIWDGHKQGFSAIVNYHKLDSSNLQRLAYTYLDRWISDQKLAKERGDAGADGRLVAALKLRSKLEAILRGDPPYDIYVRWKPLHEQPIGWEPDLKDGVRLNIRPFVKAEVLRNKLTVNWNKDRGKNPDGSERLNDIHLTREVKEAARRAVAGAANESRLSASAGYAGDLSLDAVAGETNLFGMPVQKDLFGRVIHEQRRRRR